MYSELIKIDMYNFLLDYVEELQKKGKYTFSFNNVKNVFPGSLEALKLSLNRLKRKIKLCLFERDSTLLFLQNTQIWV